MSCIHAPNVTSHALRILHPPRKQCGSSDSPWTGAYTHGEQRSYHEQWLAVIPHWAAYLDFPKTSQASGCLYGTAKIYKDWSLISVLSDPHSLSLEVELWFARTGSYLLYELYTLPAPSAPCLYGLCHSAVLCCVDLLFTHCYCLAFYYLSFPALLLHLHFMKQWSYIINHRYKFQQVNCIWTLVASVLGCTLHLLPAENSLIGFSHCIDSAYLRSCQPFIAFSAMSYYPW